MGNFFGVTRQGTSGGGGGGKTTVLGSRLAYTSPSGAGVAAAPAGFSSAVGRLLVTLTANTTWVSLTGGGDGQLLDIKIVAGNFILTLPAADFPGIGDQTLGLNNHMLLYYDTTDVLWNEATV